MITTSISKQSKYMFVAGFALGLLFIQAYFGFTTIEKEKGAIATITHKATVPAGDAAAGDAAAGDAAAGDAAAGDAAAGEPSITSVSPVTTSSERGGFTPQQDYYDACIVGAGLSGVVIAEQYASQLSKNSIIIEKRNHIGGNVYDHVDEETGILVNKYGAHLFHTKYPRVWDYLQQFSEWKIYEHRVLAFIEDKFVPVPVNIDTVNALFDLNISNKEEMNEWLDKEQVHNDDPQNSEEMALSRVGQRLYELIFEPYTFKQWAKTPKELGPEVTARIPVRNNWDDRYFDDVFQALPRYGYTKLVEKMLDNPKIEVHVNTDYFNVKSALDGKCGHTYYSGPIDHYFADQGYDKLEYRSINFERKVIKDVGEDEFHFPASVVNYPGAQYNFTRVVEYKHFLKQKSNHSVLFYERSTDEGDPYYPVPNDRNQDLYKKYQEMAANEANVTFVGRLANYKYFNMDQTIKNALELFDKDTPRVVVDCRAISYDTGGPEALLQVTLAFNSWMPTRTFMLGDYSHALKWIRNGYHEAAMLKVFPGIDHLREGDILIVPEINKCNPGLIQKGVKMFIWQLGKKATAPNLEMGCEYVSHNYWLSEYEGLDLPRTQILTPYVRRSKTNFGDVSSSGREDIILVNHDSYNEVGMLEAVCKAQERPCTVTKLQGFNVEQLNQLFAKSKVMYAKCMRGSERGALEAALGGMLILTSDCDNAKDLRDFPLPREHVVSERNKLEDVIPLMMDNFEEEQKKLEGLRYHYQHLGHEYLVKETKAFVYATVNQ